MKKELSNIAIWLVIALVLVAIIEAYFKRQEKIQERYQGHIASLQKINANLRAIINSGPTENENRIAVEKTAAELKAQEQMREAAQQAAERQALSDIRALDAQIAGESKLDVDEERIKLLLTTGYITQSEADRRAAEIQLARDKIALAKKKLAAELNQLTK